LLRAIPEIKQYILCLVETFQQKIIESVLIELTVAAMAYSKIQKLVKKFLFDHGFVYIKKQKNKH
jgi:hypothetical protein